VGTEGEGDDMQESGMMTDNRPVLAGSFPLVGTHGVPLEVVLAFFQQRGLVMDWPDYIMAIAFGL
jgi:hypothetical protein